MPTRKRFIGKANQRGWTPTDGFFVPLENQKQDKRIRIILEQDAFASIHKAWQRLGYPFKKLVPSYATAIGSSADRPEALAEIMGIIISEGVHKPAYLIQEITFAFIIGDRFFGNITAYIPGSQASEYFFTSSLPVAFLKNLAVHLKGIL